MTRPVKFILTFSIVLNLLLSGYLAGHYGFMSFNRPGKIIDHYEIAEGLPEPLRQDIKALIDETLTSLEPAKPKFDDAIERLMDILVAPSFDADLFRNQLRTLDGLHDDRHRQMASLMVKIAERFDQEQRKKLALHLRKAAPPLK